MVKDIKEAKFVIWYDNESTTQQIEYEEMMEIISDCPSIPCIVVPAKPLEGQSDNIELQNVKSKNKFRGKKAIEELRNEVNIIMKQN